MRAIGRFDIIIDTLNDCIDSYKWQAIPINEDTCPRDPKMEELITSIKNKTDLKYAKIVAKFDYELTHPARNMQTELGGVFADAMKESLGVDVFFMGSGSVRKEKLGPIVTLKDFSECYPYDGKSYGFHVTGAQFKTMLKHIYRDEAWLGEHTEFYQLSKGMHVVYSKSKHELLACELNGEEIKDDQIVQPQEENPEIDSYRLRRELEENIRRTEQRDGRKFSSEEIELLYKIRNYMEEEIALLSNTETNVICLNGLERPENNINIINNKILSYGGKRK